MRTLIINSTNLILDGQNNKLVYKFPNSVKFQDHYIALSSLQMYYSWFNITSALVNNTFSYNWIDNTGVPTTYTITIPDGVYEIATLNALLQFEFIQNNHYLISSTGDNVYYAEFLVNPSRYAVQINTFLFPTALPAGFTAPAGLTFPPQSFNPIITLPAQINQIFGYVAGFATDQNLNNAFVPPVSPYVSKLANGTLSYISTTAPNVQPNSSVLVNMSNIDNDYAQPTGIIYTIIPSVGIGEIINEKPPAFIWNKLINGTYNELRINLLGTNLSPIKINDPSMVFVFVIREATENI
jgi:hypothetical protein